MNATPAPHAPRTALRVLLWSGALALLLLPALAMKFSDEVAWDTADFIVFGAMLLVACSLVEAAMRRFRGLAGAAGALLAVGTGFLLAWANLAVGIVGAPADPANLVFFALLALVGAGALITRLRAPGTPRTLLAGAAALALTTPWVLLADGPVAATACALVAVAWSASAALLRHAARTAGT